MRSAYWPLLVLLGSLRAAAVDTIEITLGSIEGSAWRAVGVSMELHWQSAGQAALKISAKHLTLPAPLKNLTNLALLCPAAVIGNDITQCKGGSLRLASPLLDPGEMVIDFTYRHASGELDMILRDVQFADGSVTITGKLGASGWQVKSRASNIEIARLPDAFKSFLGWPTGYTGAGKLDVIADVAGQEDTVREIKLKGALNSFNFSDQDALHAGEKLSVDVELDLQPMRDGWNLQFAFSPSAGQLYLDPLFLDFSGQTAQLSGRGAWHQSQNRLVLDELQLNHPNIVQGRASLDINLNPWQLTAATLQASSPNLGQVYKTYLQPLLIGSVFDALEGEGSIDVSIDYQEQAIASTRIKLSNAHIEDQKGRYELHGMTGEIAWTRNAAPVTSRLSWEGGQIYQVTFGASRAMLESASSQLRLTEGMTLPVLDGQIVVDSFTMARPGTPHLVWQVGGALAPMSMEAFTQAMGWPSMSGKLSGIIPEISYADDTIKMGGALLMRVFDGDVVVRNLRLERPFDPVPLLSADVDMDNLDLEPLTRAFSFGKIQGRLDGTLHDLRMENWQPVAFDARFATPPDDDSRHRISQQAVDSLSSLGGVGGALSRSFLRFFDEFSYSRLGITCRLENGVCEMGGVEPAKTGYTIVKGGGLPRIDVIGYARQVDWNVLLERLKNATESEEPVVR